MPSRLLRKTASVAVLAFCASMTLFTAHTNAAPQVFVQVFGSAGGTNNGSVTDSDGPVQRSSSGSGDLGSGVARASADFGLLRNFAQASAIAGSANFNNNVLATSESFFQDDLTINALGLEGTSGSLRIKFTIDGILSASQPQIDPDTNQTRASAGYTLFLFGFGTLREGSERLNADGTRTSVDNGAFLNIEQTATVPFTFGTPFTLKLTVTTGASAYTQFGGTALADLENTAEWGGFESVQNAQGQPVQGYSFSSSSGTDYVSPIPEPSTPLLLLGMAVGILSRRAGR